MLSAIGRIARSAGRLMLMEPTYCGAIEKTLANSYKAKGFKGFHTQIVDAMKAGEKATKNSSFCTEIKKLVTDLPKDISKGWAGKGAWAKTCGVGGALMRRLPLLFVAFQIPGIYSAFKEEGLVGGLKETFRTVVQGAGSMVGFMLGQTLIPIPLVGGLIGAFASDWLLGKGLNLVMGKSHSEKKAEAEQAQAQQQEALVQMMQGQMTNPYPLDSQQTQVVPKLNIPRITMTPQQLAIMGQALYGSGNPMDMDFMEMTSGIGQMGRLNYQC